MLLLEIEWTKAQVIAALIAGLFSLIIAVWNYFAGRKSQREIEKTKYEFTREVEMLKTDLAERKSENDARRSYEFDARKRLYEEYEPLLFQLIEAADNALHRIWSLARTSRHGDLGEHGWLSQFGYYSKSTLYIIFAPVALYQIMRKKLTLVDISVDKNIGLRYKLAKQLYASYTDDYEFARLYPKIEYDPNDRNWEKLRNDKPSKFWRQGLPLGLLDKTIELFIEKDSNGKEYLISYGEFERKLADQTNEKAANIHLSRDIFLSFNPKQRPVLWRLLVTQSLILKALIELKEIKLNDLTETALKDLLLKYSKEDLIALSWSTNVEDEPEIEEAIKVGIEYLGKRF